MYFTIRSLLKALILVGTVSSVVCSKVPRFTSRPKKSYTVNEGGRVKLKCLVTGADDPNHNRTLTAWRKEGVPPRHSVIRKSPMWERFKVKNGKYLRIRNVHRGDAGRYWCIAKNLHGMIHAAINLKVIPRPINSTVSDYVTSQPRTPKPTGAFKGPQFISKKTSHAIKKAKGKMVKLSCEAKGTPRPKVKWYKDKRPFNKSKSRFRYTSWRLTIRKLKNKDSGVYNCLVWNRHGNITRTFYVLVIDDSAEPPETTAPVIQTNFLKNKTAMEGQSVTFTCAALSDKAPQFAWVKWISIYNSTSYNLLNSSSPNVRLVREVNRYVGGRISYSQKLEILNVSKTDQGQYTCFVGTDGLRIVSSHVFLTVKQHKPTADLTGVKGLTSNTSEPPRLIEGIDIPLAAIIAVPAALSTILIVAIIWCYVQTVKHRYQRYQHYGKTATFAPGSNEVMMNGTYKGHQTINNMETFTNGHVLHKPMYTPEVTLPEVKYELEVRHEPEVRDDQGMTPKEEIRELPLRNSEMCRNRSANAYTENPISTENSLGQSDSNSRTSTTDLNDTETLEDTSPNNLKETICTQNLPIGNGTYSDTYTDRCTDLKDNTHVDDDGVQSSVV